MLRSVLKHVIVVALGVAAVCCLLDPSAAQIGKTTAKATDKVGPKGTVTITKEHPGIAAGSIEVHWKYTKCPGADTVKVTVFDANGQPLASSPRPATTPGATLVTTAAFNTDVTFRVDVLKNNIPLATTTGKGKTR